MGALSAPPSLALSCRWRSRPQHQKQTHAPQRTIRSFPNLERYVEAHPELFVQAIAWTYKRKDGATDPAEFQVPPERIETMAERGHKLLDAIERIPGHNHLGELEATRLATWIAAVRQGGPHRKGYASLSPKPIREFHRSQGPGLNAKPSYTQGDINRPKKDRPPALNNNFQKRALKAVREQWGHIDLHRFPLLVLFWRQHGEGLTSSQSVHGTVHQRLLFR